MNNPLTPEALAEIEARCEAATELIDEMHRGRLAYSEYLILRDGIDDVDFLLAEVRRLAEENERLRGLVGCGCGLCLAHNGMICPKLPEPPEEGADHEAD